MADTQTNRGIPGLPAPRLFATPDEQHKWNMRVYDALGLVHKSLDDNGLLPEGGSNDGPWTRRLVFFGSESGGFAQQNGFTFVPPTGRLGVGTNEPQSGIHVTGNTISSGAITIENNLLNAIDSAGDASLRMFNADGDWSVQTQTSGRFQINDGAVVGGPTRLCIDIKTGYVGLGIAPEDAVDAMLHIVKEQDEVTAVYVTNTDAGVSASSVFRAYNDAGSYVSLGIGSSASTADGTIASGMSYLRSNNSGGTVLVSTGGNMYLAAGSTTASVVLTTAGRFSVGTLTPNTTLHVAWSTSGANTGAVLESTLAAPAGSDGDVNLSLVNTVRSWMLQTHTGGRFGIYDLTAASDPVRLQIDTSGRVGIGYTNIGDTLAFGLDMSTATADDGIRVTGSGVGGPHLYLEATNATVGNRFAQIVYRSSATYQWAVGIRAGDGHYHVYDIVGARTSLQVTSTGSTVLGPQAALATNATDGFAYIPTCAGAPTGAPTAFTGKVAMVFDTTNNKLMVYDGGWIGVVLA